MELITISSKYQIIIPKPIREKLKLEPGQKIQIIEHDNYIELIPLRSVKELRGFLKGIDTTIIREDDRI